MRYLIALLCPPLAILLCKKPILAIISIPLALLYFPSALLALLVVSGFYADRRQGVLVGAMDVQAAAAQKFAIRQAQVQAKAARVAQAAALASAPATAIPATEVPAKKGLRVAQAMPEEPAGDRKPMITFAQVRDSLVDAKVAAIRAYQALPEWAQPVTWGLAAGTPASIALAIVIMLRR